MCSVLWLICLWDCCVLDNIRQKKNKASCYPKYEQTLDFVYAYTRQDSDIVAWNVWTYNKVTVCVQAEPEYKRENVPPPEVHVSCVLTPISIGIWVRENNKQAKPKHKILWDLVRKCVMCCSVSDATIRVSEWTRGCLCLCGHLWEWVLVECPVLATIKWVLHSVVSSHREDTVEEATPCHTTDYAAVVERESLERHLSASNHTFANLLSNSLCAPCLRCWSSGLD